MNAPTPLPIPDSVRSVLLFGGLFDPPHIAHVRLAVQARDEALGPDTYLVYVPAARSPHKAAGPAANDRHRLAMLALALDEVPRCAVWTDEIDRGGSSFWIDTLGRARSLLGPHVSQRFLIGADQAAAFDRWRDFRGILALADPLVLLREPMLSTHALLGRMRATGSWSEADLARWSGFVWDGSVASASSTESRSQVVAGELLADIDPRVREYIERHGLYRDQ